MTANDDTLRLFPASKAPKLYNLTFVHKGVQFIFMDWGPKSKAVLPARDTQVSAPGIKIGVASVIVCHQHVKPIGSRWLDNFIADEIDDFWEIVTEPGIQEKVLGILCGHVPHHV